jgi:magnesium-transporting ATPase (P-type)
LSSTQVREGSATMVVTAVGLNTQMGIIMIAFGETVDPSKD